MANIGKLCQPHRIREDASLRGWFFSRWAQQCAEEVALGLKLGGQAGFEVEKRKGNMSNSEPRMLEKSNWPGG